MTSQGVRVGRYAAQAILGSTDGRGGAAELDVTHSWSNPSKTFTALTPSSATA
jgi:hypothetical protein